MKKDIGNKNGISFLISRPSTKPQFFNKVCISLAILLLVLWGTVYAGTINVPGDYNKIQDAIDAANTGDEIIVEPGVYEGSIYISGKNVYLHSKHPYDPDMVAQTVIDAQRSWTCVDFGGSETEDCILAGFTITNGKNGWASGGGISGNGTKATIRNNVIKNNCVYDGGFGWCCGGGIWKCDGIIEDNVITNNSANYGGGLAYCHGIIRRNIISNNVATVSGGGLAFCSETSHNTTLIENNIIIGNRANNAGGGAGGSIFELINNVFFANSARLGGGVEACQGTIKNCIIWGNSASEQGAQLHQTSEPTFSCIQDWSENENGNISSDPRFVDSTNNDFRLNYNSPCIDAGDPASHFNDGSRPPGKGTERNDIGAYGGPGNSGWLDPINLIILKLTIYDSNTGDPIQDANVALGTVGKETDSDGEAVFSDLCPGEYVVEISAPVYETYRTPINLKNSGTVSLQYGLIPASDGTENKPVVIDVTSYVSNRNKSALFLHGVDHDVNFSVHVSWNGKIPDKIRFVTPNNIYDENCDGATASHMFNMGQDFGVGGRLRVVAFSQDGTESAPFDANIEVMPLPPGLILTPNLKYINNDFSYELHLTTGIITAIVSHNGTAVPEEIPILGNNEISFGASAEISVIIGSDGLATYSFIRPKTDEDAFKLAGVAFDTGWELGGDIIFKYDQEDDAWHFDGGYVTSSISVHVQKGIGPAYTVVFIGPVPVPVYLRGELGAELDGTIGFTGWAEASGWQLDGALEPGASGRAIAGVGVASVIAVEGYLGIDASMLLAFPDEPLLREALIVMSGGIQLVTLFHSPDPWQLWEYTWFWSEETGASSFRVLLEQEPLADIRSLDWKPIPRNYTSGLPAKSEGRAALRLLSTALAGTEETLPDQTHIYPYSYPALISMGNDLLLAWITDDRTKTENNRTSLAFSTYADSQWYTPTKVAEDSTADFYPSVAPLSGGAVVTWQDSGTVFGDDATMDDMLPEQEISVCLYDAANSSWGTSTRLTSNAYLDRSPVVAASNDKAAVVWVSNEQNDMFGSADKPNSLRCSFFDGTAWSPESTIASGVGGIIKRSLAYSGDSATYVFVVDTDSDLSTVIDQELYMTTFDGTTWAAVTRLTDDNVQDTNPQLAYDQNGDLLLVWYKDGNFRMAKNLDMINSQTVVEHELSSGAADFRLAVGATGQISIVWPDSSPKGQDIYMAMYDSNLNIWGTGTMLTDTDDMERSLSCVQTAEGNIAIAYNRVETITTTRQVDVGGNLVDVDVPGAGKTDLCMATVSIEGDLSVSSEAISLTPTEISLGGALTITTTVSNIGLKGAESVAVEFYYGDPANGGLLIGSRQTIAGPIAPGGSATVSASGWQVPEVPDSGKDIYVVVDPDLGYEDRDRSNNTAHISVFKPDIEISQMYWQAVGPVKRAITVSLKNIGTVPASSIPLTINEQGPSGSSLYQETIDSLAVNESKDVVYEWDTTGEETTNGYLKAYAAVNRDQTIPETSYLNNSRIIQVLGAIPGAVTNPSIPSGTTGVSLRPTLDWDDVPGATSYDLYLWKQSDAKPQTPTVVGLTESQYVVQTSLVPLTTYHWHVVAKNSSGGSEGPEWTFTTKEVMVGDINDGGEVNLVDAILALQVLTGQSPAGIRSDYASSGADVNGDGKIGIEEVIYILQTVAGLRHHVEHYVTGCKVAGDPNFETDSEQFLADVVGGKLIMRHIDAVYNCCIEDIEVSVSISGNVIDLHQTEILEAPCDCLCPYDITTVIGNLAPGVYTVYVQNVSGLLGKITDVVIPGSSECNDNGECMPGFYCAKMKGDCGGQGHCSPRPEVCITLYDPVCGCDGVTYGNACEAARAGVSVAYDGPCMD